MLSVQIPITLFDTGVLVQSTPLADNQTDPHYQLIDANGTGLMPGAARTIVADGFPIGPWVGNSPESRWIVPAATDADGNAAAGTFDYRTTFDLSQVDPATVTISGQWAADDSATIYINGASTGISVSGFGSLTSFTLSSGFRSGTNTLDFVVTNGGGPTGLRVTGLTGSGLPGTQVAVQNVAFGTGVDSSGQTLPATTAPAVTDRNSSGAGLADLDVDGNFSVTSAPSGYTGGVKVRTSAGGFPFPYWAGDSVDSAWLVPAAADSAGNAPPGEYTFTTTMDVTDPTNMVLSGLWAADDSATIWVNGTDTGVSVSGFASMTSFLLTGSYIVFGSNTVEFRVTNGGTSDNPTGMRVEWADESPSVDSHWTVVSAPDSSMLGPVKAMTGGAYPLPPWVPNDSNSQ